jgi:hypothetical protein
MNSWLHPHLAAFDGCCEARLAVMLDAPVVHVVEDIVGMVDDQVDAFGNLKTGLRSIESDNYVSDIMYLKVDISFTNAGIKNITYGRRQFDGNFLYSWTAVLRQLL